MDKAMDLDISMTSENEEIQSEAQEEAMENAIEEQNNYSSYKANELVDIDKYISEKDTFISTLIAKASLKNQKLLLIAPTGSGKTFTMINSLKKAHIKAIFIVPNSFNVEQIEKEYGIKGAWGDISVKSILDDDLISLTWDKFIQLDQGILSEYIVILDEVHQTLIDLFRLSKINKLYESLSFTKGQIHITATPNKLDFKQYDYILEYRQSLKTDYQVFVYDDICDDKILEIVEDSTRFGLFKDDKKYLNFIKESGAKLGKRIDTITSDNKLFSPAYKEIIESSSINGFDGICNTRALAAGVNINNSNITDIIIINEKDIATIKQYVARFRDLERINIHIFNKYVCTSKSYEIEWLIQAHKNRVNSFLDYFNKYEYDEKIIEQYIHTRPFKLENRNEYYYNTELKKYVLNEVGIRSNCYTDYYNQATIEQYCVLLKEYFSEVEIVKLKMVETSNNKSRKYSKQATEKMKADLKHLQPYKSHLVGAIQLITDGEMYSELKLYFLKNKIDKVKQKDFILNEVKLGSYLKQLDIIKILNLYTEYVTKKGFSYNIAWSLAIRNPRARAKIFDQINYLVYKEIEKSYAQYIDKNSPEYILYKQIQECFKVGKSYTSEHLNMFIEMYEIKNPFSILTKNELLCKLNVMFLINKVRPRSVELDESGKSLEYDFLFDKTPKFTEHRRPIIYTIVDEITLDSLSKKNGWFDIDKTFLSSHIEDKVKAQVERIVNFENNKKISI